MSFPFSRPSRGRKGRYLPQCETLEDRSCPAVTGNVVADHILVIEGDHRADVVNLSDDGHGGITLTGAEGEPILFTGIDHVVIRTYGGRDTVNYTLDGIMTGKNRLRLDLGFGGDTANLDFTAGIAGASNNRANLRINYNSTLGNDQLNADFGPVLESVIYVVGDMGYGNDSVSLDFHSAFGPGTVCIFDIAGGVGDDHFNVNATETDVHIGDLISFHLHGNPGDDTLNFSHEGQVLSWIGAALEGGIGDDTITADWTLSAGSTGGMSTAALGDFGNDHLTVNVTVQDVAPNLPDVFAIMQGGLGNDTGVGTSNVTQEGIEL